MLTTIIALGLLVLFLLYNLAIAGLSVSNLNKDNEIAIQVVRMLALRLKETDAVEHDEKLSKLVTHLLERTEEEDA
ncbi:hypothetical protein [Brochothrix phage BtpYZU04]